MPMSCRNDAQTIEFLSWCSKLAEPHVSLAELGARWVLMSPAEKEAYNIDDMHRPVHLRRPELPHARSQYGSNPLAAKCARGSGSLSLPELNQHKCEIPHALSLAVQLLQCLLGCGRPLHHICINIVDVQGPEDAM